MKSRKKVALIVLDGWGYREEKEHNTIALADTPFFDEIWKKYPHSVLLASGEAVGLPQGQMGNSEVGHLIIGAGRVLDTDLVKIDKSIRDNAFEKNEVFRTLFDHVKKHNSVLHVCGLVSPGGVHSHSNHLYSFLKIAKANGIKKIAIHAFTDGRDVPPRSAHLHLKELEGVIEKAGIGFIATASGRFYAMDRDNNWDRLKKVEGAIFCGTGEKETQLKPSELVKKLHGEGVYDQYIEPTIFVDRNGESYRVEENDGIFFFNFRKDRARMLSQQILKIRDEKNLCFATMTRYDKNHDCLVAFSPDKTETTLANEISRAGLTQAHIAETEKFAHSTYYLNGGRQEPHIGEEQILVDSRKDVKTHDQAPEMRAREIVDESKKFFKKGTDFIFINFANPDMVGHTENPKALKLALEAVDRELKRVVEYGLLKNYEFFITADHGNAELSFDTESNQLHTAHTTSPVPCIHICKDNTELRDGSLADIAPTVLSIMGLPIPKSMTGKSLIKS